jgi:signal transduction histidine kinase
MPPTEVSASAAPPLPFWRRIDPARARFWGVLVPIHLLAFAALYFGTLQLLERAYTQAGATAARFELDRAVRQMPLLVEAGRVGNNPHVFGNVTAANQPLGLRLYDREARPLGSRSMSTDASELARVRALLASRENGGTDFWNEQVGGRQWLRGAVRLRTDQRCVPCHALGSTLGAATVRLDFTDNGRQIHEALGSRMALLLLLWVGLIAAVTFTVQRTVRRSAEHLRADLAAASSGTLARDAAHRLPLDPVTAEMHRSLREFLSRQKERETHVARRLEHVDQLASLGQLAAGLAHEIKNPLAGIQGALERLRDETADAPTGRLYGEMLAELERVNGILRRLLESGRRAPLRLVRTDLAKLLGETAELLRPSLRRQRVELRVEVAAALPPAELDSAKIRQVLVNLIQNAAEAMAERGGHVVVRASALPEAATVVVEVEDDGPGIGPEHLDKLFEPFFTTKFAGTGLGLAISKTLVEQHGGRIEVSSASGGGTSFLVFLPAGQPREAD